MKIQIYVAHPDDAELCDQLGVDLIGVVVDPALRTPSSLTIAQAAAAFSRIRNAKKVALCMDASLSAITGTIRDAQPDVLHFGCDPNSLSRVMVDEVRSQFSGTELMFAVPVNGSSPEAVMEKFDPVADYFILDTSDPTRPDVGATGQTHDWTVSAKLVARTGKRVVLAGGLSPENVGRAIDVVGPWAVDSFTKTNKVGETRKDPDRLSAFIRAARG